MPTLMRRLWIVLVAAVVASAAGAGASGCKAPTQISIDVRTNGDCTNAAAWRGLSVYIGKPGLDVETKAPTLTTSSCSAGGEIGTLFITPSGAKDDEVGIRVVAGLDKGPEECAAAGYAGCIVARRDVRFSQSSTVDVIIDLTLQCTGIACDSTRTCVNGTCTDARESNVEDVTTNADAAPPLASEGGASSDGGALLDAALGPGVISFDEFEDGFCGKWSGMSALLTNVAGGANGTGHACQACFTDPSGAMTLGIDASQYSFETFQVDGFMRAGTSATGWGAYVSLADDAGMTTATMTNGGPASSSWQQFQIIVSAPGPVKSGGVFLSAQMMMPVGTCMQFDEIKVTGH
jgi:hypothetical protein